MSLGRLINVLDGLTKFNLHKANNHGIRWAEEDGFLPKTELAKKHLMVAPSWAGDSVRYHDVTKGPLTIQINAFLENPSGKNETLDAECNDPLIISGSGKGTTPAWSLLDREQFSAGKFTYTLDLEGSGKGVIYAFNPKTQAYGCMVDFCWGVGPGKYE